MLMERVAACVQNGRLHVARQYGPGGDLLAYQELKAEGAAVSDLPLEMRMQRFCGTARPASVQIATAAQQHDWTDLAHSQPVTEWGLAECELAGIPDLFRHEHIQPFKNSRDHKDSPEAASPWCLYIRQDFTAGAAMWVNVETGEFEDIAEGHPYVGLSEPISVDGDNWWIGLGDFASRLVMAETLTRPIKAVLVGGSLPQLMSAEGGLFRMRHAYFLNEQYAVEVRHTVHLLDPLATLFGALRKADEVGQRQ